MLSGMLRTSCITTPLSSRRFCSLFKSWAYTIPAARVRHAAATRYFFIADLQGQTAFLSRRLRRYRFLAEELSTRLRQERVMRHPTLRRDSFVKSSWRGSAARKARTLRCDDRVERKLKASEKNENGHNEEHHADATGRGVTPVATEGPPGERSEKRQDQKDNQDSSKHGLLLCKRMHPTKFKFPAPAALLAHCRMARRAGRYSTNEPDRLLDHDSDGETRAGIVRVVHVIAAVHVIDVEVVGVVPVRRPGINETEPKAAVLEARVSADHNWVAHAEGVTASKVGTETIIGNAAAAPGTEAELRLSALSGHGLLGALGTTMRRGSLLLFVGLGLLQLFLLLLLGLGLGLLFRLGLLFLFRGLGLLFLFRGLGLLFLFRGLGLLVLFLLLLGLGLRLLFRLGLFLLLRLCLILLFRLSLLLLFRGLGIFFLFLLACVGRNSKSQNQ